MIAAPAAGVPDIAMPGPGSGRSGGGIRCENAEAVPENPPMPAAEKPTRAPRRRVAKGPPRPQYLESPDVDKVVIMLLALAAEVSALRDRVDTHEALAEGGNTPTGRAVEGYALPAERQSERETRRQAMLHRVLRVLAEEVDGLREAGAPGA